MHQLERVVASSTSSPAYRMRLAHVVRDPDGKIYRDALPVVALRTTVYQVFTTHCKHKPIDTGTVKELKENGWVLDRHEVKTEAMVAGEGDDIMTAWEYRECNGGVVQLVTCTWPLDDDVTQFRPILQRMMQDVADSPSPTECRLPRP